MIVQPEDMINVYAVVTILQFTLCVFALSQCVKQYRLRNTLAIGWFLIFIMCVLYMAKVRRS
jgi:hypothetical protein